MVSRLTALEAEGVRLSRTEAVHVVVPHGIHVPPLPQHPVGLVVHTGRRLRPEVLHPVKRPVRMRATAAWVEAAAWASTEALARSILSTVVQHLSDARSGRRLGRCHEGHREPVNLDSDQNRPDEPPQSRTSPDASDPATADDPAPLDPQEQPAAGGSAGGEPAQGEGAADSY